jgi:hypothetical protein
MPRYAAYVVRIWWSTTSAGRQWVAQVQHLSGGETWRFTDPVAFLGHMQAAAGNVGSPPVDMGDPLPHQGSMPKQVVQTEREEG